MHFRSQTTTCSTKFCTTFSYCKQWTLQRPCWKRAYILMHKYLCTGSLKTYRLSIPDFVSQLWQNFKRKNQESKAWVQGKCTDACICMNISISTSLIPKTFYVFEVWEWGQHHHAPLQQMIPALQTALPVGSCVHPGQQDKHIAINGVFQEII